MAWKISRLSFFRIFFRVVSKIAIHVNRMKEMCRVWGLKPVGKKKNEKKTSLENQSAQPRPSERSALWKEKKMEKRNYGTRDSTEQQGGEKTKTYF